MNIIAWGPQVIAHLEDPISDSKVLPILNPEVPLFQNNLHSLIVLLQDHKLYLRVGEVGLGVVGAPSRCLSRHPRSSYLCHVPLWGGERLFRTETSPEYYGARVWTGYTVL